MSIPPVALITGASRGIGRAIALELAGLKYDIVAISRNIKSANMRAATEELKSAINAEGASFLPIQADIGNLPSHKKILEEIQQYFERIHVLVNNAGIGSIERKDVLDTSIESFDRVLSVNLRGTFFLTQAIARKMIADAEPDPGYLPKIIFITSISAKISSPSRAEYCISKAGLSMAARIFADRLTESGIKVHEIRPGIIDTDMTAPVKEKYNNLIQQGKIPLKRWGRPGDVAKAVGAIARGDFDYSTGSIFDLSGGLNLQSL
jgi:NAD(P)-dependent dehydrogenase (short-subunit alcohol dehydrogenase family)